MGRWKIPVISPDGEAKKPYVLDSATGKILALPKPYYPPNDCGCVTDSYPITQGSWPFHDNCAAAFFPNILYPSLDWFDAEVISGVEGYVHGVPRHLHVAFVGMQKCSDSSLWLPGIFCFDVKWWEEGQPFYTNDCGWGLNDYGGGHNWNVDGVIPKYEDQSSASYSYVKPVYSGSEDMWYLRCRLVVCDPDNPSTCREVFFGQIPALSAMKFPLSIHNGVNNCSEGALLYGGTAYISNPCDLSCYAPVTWNNEVSYSINDTVSGSNSDYCYKCKEAHESSIYDAPETGANWAVYWIRILPQPDCNWITATEWTEPQYYLYGRVVTIPEEPGERFFCINEHGASYDVTRPKTGGYYPTFWKKCD